MSYRSIDFDAPGIHCDVHGLRPAVAMPPPMPAECLECAQYARVANMAAWKPAPVIRISRRMLCAPGIVCASCGELCATLPTAQQWRDGLSVVWQLRNRKRGFVWNNVYPTHFRCRSIIGPNDVDTRAGNLERWRKAAAALQRDTKGIEQLPHVTLSAFDVYTLTRQHKTLVRRHASRFGMPTDLTPDDLTRAWRVHGGCCKVCREPIELYRHMTNTLSWDRWANCLGYTADNVAPTCWPCNAMKSAFTVEDCLRVVQLHHAFKPPKHFIQEPTDPEACVTQEEVALIKRLRRVYRPPPPEREIRIFSSEADFMALPDVVQRILRSHHPHDLFGPIVRPVPSDDDQVIEYRV